MKYIVDTNVFIPILNYYYEDIFISFWEKFNELVKENIIISVRDVYKELENSKNFNILKKFEDIFLEPNNDEIDMIREMLNNPNFIKSKDKDKIINGKPYADLYIIAKAKKENCIIVTDETFIENAPKIPTICKYYNIECINMHDFIKRLNLKL